MEKTIVITNRWWVYQRERFPIFAHAPLIAAFSFSALSYSSLLRGEIIWPTAQAFLVTLITSIIFFLQLRIADEFKDFDEDARYRPYRAVPRGLVRLRELGWLGAFGAFTQFALAIWLQPKLLILLLVTWFYLALMSKEFFVREWLKARPITYLWTHMLIVPLVDFYATGCDWLVAGKSQTDGLLWFLCVSFCNGIVIEVGRKLRAPADEEEGVQTYTVLWGCRRAVFVWLGVLLLTAICAVFAALKIAFVFPVALILGALILVAATISLHFLRCPKQGRGKRFEIMSGVWTLALYLCLGAFPLVSKIWCLQ